MKKWFTLIEMLIVVVIIGILASALIPRISSAKDRAQNTAAVKDVGDIVTALTIYQMDNGWYPVSVSCNGTVKTECTLSGVYTELSKYLKSIPQGNNKVPQWTIGNGNIVPAWNAYGYIGTGQRYILSYQFIDTRDGQRYKAVRMPDERRWMAENLNFKTANSSCYNDIESNCDNDYGRLYDWNEAQNACPQWWKLPSDDERTIMLNEVENVFWWIENHASKLGWGTYGVWLYAGKVLQTATWWTIATDSLWFSILLAGWWNAWYMYRDTQYGFFWSSTQEWSTDGRRRRFDRNLAPVFHLTAGKWVKMSVRCIQ